MKRISLYLLMLIMLCACAGRGRIAHPTDKSFQLPIPSLAVVSTAVTSCGELGQASTTYTLLNDVSSDGTCFTIKAPNVVLNLNGHTVTYDNRMPISVPNGDFELDLAGTWDTTNAPNAAREAGSYVKPVTLYSGNYALRFNLPFTGVQYVRSQPVTLAANTTYSISAMFRNSGNNELPINTYVGGVRDPIAMKIELEGTSSSVTRRGVTWRGFQFDNFVYTTGVTPESHTIRITIDNVPSGATGYVYVDDIKILKTASYGVEVASGYTSPKTARVTNGAIVQGQGGGFASHAIKIGESGGAGWTVDHLTLTTHGANSKALFSYYMAGASFNNNTINHNVTTIKSRDAFDGAAVHIPYASSAGTIYSNTFNTGIQTAIYVKTANRNQHKIYSNNITLQTKYTNDFAIAAGGSEVYDNVINCGSGNNSCRGIWIGGTNTKAYNNTVLVQQLVRNQEYNGCQAAGAYGMQAEYGSTGVQVFNNKVTAVTGVGICEAAALRLNSAYDGTTSLEIHNNEFKALNTGNGATYAMKLANLYGPGYQIKNNTFSTNGRWMYLDYDQNPIKLMSGIFTGNRFQTIGRLPKPYYPFLVNYGVHGAFVFDGNKYGSSDDQHRFESEAFRKPDGSRDPNSSITIVMP